MAQNVVTHVVKLENKLLARHERGNGGKKSTFVPLLSLKFSLKSASLIKAFSERLPHHQPTTFFPLLLRLYFSPKLWLFFLSLSLFYMSPHFLQFPICPGIFRAAEKIHFSSPVTEKQAVKVYLLCSTRYHQLKCVFCVKSQA